MSSIALPAGVPAVAVVKANGFTVISDGGTAGSAGDLHLLSLLGHRAAVEAIGAACLTGRGAVVYPAPLQAGIAVHAPLAWQFRQIGRRLPSGDSHLILLPARADMTRLQEGSFTVIAPLDGSRGDEMIARLHYLFLSQSTSTPLAAEWEQWLWTRAQQREEARGLRCWGTLPAAWACSPDIEALRRDLIAGLRGATTYGRLPHLEGSMPDQGRESVA
jgi:hypothetical protein